MTEITIDIPVDSDAMLMSIMNTANNGGSNWMSIGNRSSSGYGIVRELIRFLIPKFSGNIISQELRLKTMTSIWGTPPYPIGVYLVSETQGDVWVEGNGSLGIGDTLDGVTWDVLSTNFPWDTVGGDFDKKILSLKQVPITIHTWHAFSILKENQEFLSGKTYTLIVKFPYDNATEDRCIDFYSRETAVSGDRPVLRIVVEIDGFDTPTLTSEPISSTQIDISWDKSQLADDNFTHYLLEQSDTGVGGWTTLATITDKDTLKHEHTGVVVQGDVDDYDEDSDTYPSGRTKYYRMSVVSDVFGATGYGTADATTIPAIRPVSLTFNPKSKYWNEDFIDDNRAYKPYGVEVIPSWYDSLDITEENYIDKLTVEAYFRGASTWPGAASETNDFSPVDFDNGGIIEGDTGYKPYKIKGKIYDTGGLYRKATTDKSNEQFDVAWPAPCPVAIPDGAYADAPPALLGRPFSAGDLVPVDLFRAGQQSGEKIFEEDFLGTAPNDAGKWRWYNSAGVSAPIYSTGILSAPIIESTFNTIGTKSLKFIKILRDEGSIENQYNKYLSKYTGGYRVRYVFRIDNWDRTGVIKLFINSGFWIKDFSDGVSRGYSVIFDSTNNNLIINRNQVIGGNSSATLLTSGLSTDAPLLLANEGKFFLVDIIISPYFSSSGDGDSVMVVYNIASTLAGVLNIDYKTHPYIFSVNSIAHPVGDRTHYTGRHGFWMYSIWNQINAIIQVYNTETLGRIGAIGTGQGYGAKNLTHDQILELVNSPIPTFPITASPELASELCYIEGRIKNEYGAQSRTGEVDDYQGDTFNNAIPIGFLSVPKTGFVGADVLIDASQSIDPEGGALIYKYDFGDTETLETSQSSVSHQYASTGTYTVKLIVEDEAGLLSVEVQAIIKIYDALDQFDEVSLMSPWESINEGSPPGTSKTSHPELDYDTIQTMDGGNRVFSLTGQHHDPDCDIALATRITNAENEKDYFHVLYNQSKLITLDLVFFGKVRGVITDHKPAMAVDDQQAFKFSMTFQEIDVRQFE